VREVGAGADGDEKPVAGFPRPVICMPGDNHGRPGRLIGGEAQGISRRALSCLAKKFIMAISARSGR